MPLFKRSAWPSRWFVRRSRWKSRARLPAATQVRTIFPIHPIDQDIRTQCALSRKKVDIRVAVGDCSVTERRRWRPPYQTGKTVHVHAKHYTHCGNVPDMVSYPGIVASLNKHNWRKNKTVSFCLAHQVSTPLVSQ